MTKQPSCHPERKHAAHGLCASCYKNSHRRANKEHYAVINKEWRTANNERLRKQARDYDRKNIERYLLKVAKSRAKKFGLEFELAEADIVVPSICPVLGIPLVPFSGRFAHSSPSIDRIDNTKGYTKDNIIVVSFRANSLKKDATVGELKMLSNFYVNLLGGMNK